MKSLYLRIYLTVVAVLLVFALVSGWLFQRNVERERENMQGVWSERAAGWAALLENSLPASNAPIEEQRVALLRMVAQAAPAAGDGRCARTAHRRFRGLRAARSRRPTVRRRARSGCSCPTVARCGSCAGAAERTAPAPEAMPGPRRGAAGRFPAWPAGHAASSGVGLAVTLVVPFRRDRPRAPIRWCDGLTRRLESLKQGVETFGARQA